MFKGGISLSKVFNLIGRFSEDIDLILDWRLVSNENTLTNQDSKNKQIRFNEQINENAKEYIQNELLPIISQILSPLCICTIAEDEFSINVRYLNAFNDSYLRPEILLEIGPLASWLPSDSFEISSFAAQKFPQVFEKTNCTVNTIVAKRTFWEKATILHLEANRPADSTMPTRYSRYYYDLVMIAKSEVKNEVKNEALAYLELLKNVVDFKQKIYPRKWAKYEEAVSRTLKLSPPKFRLDSLEKDYKFMQNMIFDKYISFEEIIEILENLEKKINEI